MSSSTSRDRDASRSGCYRLNRGNETEADPPTLAWDDPNCSGSFDAGRWTLDEARALASRVAGGLTPINVVFAIYGSVLVKGSGNDLDAIAFQLWADPRYSFRDIRSILERETGSRIEVVERKPGNHTRCRMMMPDGKVVDLQVWCFFACPDEGGPA